MCLFCDMNQGKIPCRKVYEDEWVFAIKDIHPQAPIHILVIPKVHKDNLLSFEPTDNQLLMAVFQSIQKITSDMKISETGFRVVMNTGPMGGQTVDHVHFHVLGGRIMTWPPG